MSRSIVAHLRRNGRKRIAALIERDIFEVRTRVYAHAALRRYFLDVQRTELACRLERLMAAMGMLDVGGRLHD